MHMKNDTARSNENCWRSCFAIKTLRHFVYGRKFTIVTDHCSLRHVLNLHDPYNRIYRQVLYLMGYDFDVIYRKGSENVTADALSRYPLESRGPADLSEDVLTLSVTDWISHQSRDPFCQQVRARMASDVATADGFHLKEGRLVKLHQGQDLLVLPKSLFPEIFNSFHDELGHFGNFRTMAPIANRFFYPGLAKKSRSTCRAVTSVRSGKATIASLPVIRTLCPCQTRPLK